jgi:hypothetical protein
MTSPHTTLHTLHTGLTRRRAPQNVAVDLIALGIHTELRRSNRDAAATLEQLAQARWTPTDRPIGPTTPDITGPWNSARTHIHQICTLLNIPAPADIDPADSNAALTWCADALTILGLNPTPTPLRRPHARPRTYTEHYPNGTAYNWTTRPTRKGARGNRGGNANIRTAPNRLERTHLLPNIPTRLYRRATRTTLHLQQRAHTNNQIDTLRLARTLATTRLAHTLDYTTFADDTPTAAFIAYYTARLGMQTLFTNSAQARPMDALAEALLTHATNSPTCRYDAIATVLTRRNILTHLDRDTTLTLLNTYQQNWRTIAELLHTHADPNRDRTTMIARPGDNSSAWNAGSRAFNQLRTGWLNLINALNLDNILDTYCPGKVPAMVAADVAHWHSTTGSALHTDNQIYATLPAPWDVVLGTATCTRANITDACATHNINPSTTGWTAAYQQTGNETTRATQPLVHGITVNDPALADIFRSNGLFSGRTGTNPEHLHTLTNSGLLDAADQARSNHHHHHHSSDHTTPHR